MKGKRKLLLIMAFMAFSLCLPLIADAGVPSVSEIRVTDVTTRSFSVVWIASEPSTASLQVFSTPACTEAAPGINFEPSVGSDSTGVLKATVTGLLPNTTYCFKTVTTSKSTSETTISPATPQQVTTETQTVRTYTQGTDILPFGNDLIYHPVYRFDQTIGDKKILMVSIDGGSGPVSAWTGDGIAPPDVLIDLNNIFGASTRENMNLVGGERIRLQEVRGQDGCTLERWRKVPRDVPQDNEMVEVRTPGLCFIPQDKDCNDVVDIRDIRRVALAFLGRAGDFCFNPDMDINGDGIVDIRDIRDVARHFLQRP